MVRSEVEEVLLVVEQDIGNGQGISNKRQYSVVARQIENRRKALLLASQPTKEELLKKKKEKILFLKEKEMEKKLAKELNEKEIDNCIAIFKKVANFIAPPMGHRQRTVAQRSLMNSRHSHDRCKILEAVLLSSTADVSVPFNSLSNVFVSNDSVSLNCIELFSSASFFVSLHNTLLKELKNCASAFPSTVGRVADILTSLPIPAEVFQNALERSDMLVAPDGDNFRVDGNSDYFRDVESIFLDVMQSLSTINTTKIEKQNEKTKVPTLVNEIHRNSMIATFQSMRTFTPERKKILDVLLGKFKLLMLRCKVAVCLFSINFFLGWFFFWAAIVCDLSNESIVMASTAEHASELSMEALPHIKELTRNSHMMKYTSGPKHSEIVS